MNEILLLVSDFDGTLVDTFKANFLAYQKVLFVKGIKLTLSDYSKMFGLRFNEFMQELGIKDDEEIGDIRRYKAICYPDYFQEIKLNKPLLDFLSASKDSGKFIALATTAQRANVLNILEYFNIVDKFTYLLTGEDVKYAKPHPECYLKTMEYFSVSSGNTLIFEDSEVGIAAAKRSGAHYMVINKEFYEY